VIVVAGEALIDLIITPNGAIRAVPGGGPYNAARTLGLLGADVSFLGVLSDDYFGRQLRDRLHESGVQVACQTPTPAPTSLAVAELSAEGSATYRFYLDGTSLPMLSAREAWAALPQQYEALHVGTLGLVVEPTASVLEALVEEEASTHLVLLDPNCRPAVVTDFEAFSTRVLRLFEKADVIKVSDDDVKFLFPDGGFSQAVAAVTERGGIVLHTAGSGPIDVFARDGAGQVLPAGGDVVDTVGAGDIFGATVLWALLQEGWSKGQRWGVSDVLPAVRTGAAAAHIACQRAGAEPPTRNELLARMADLAG
jgi:fructokinase